MLLLSCLAMAMSAPPALAVEPTAQNSMTELRVVPVIESGSEIKLTTRIVQLPGARPFPGTVDTGPDYAIERPAPGGAFQKAKLVVHTALPHGASTVFEGDLEVMAIERGGSFSVGEAKYEFVSAGGTAFRTISAPTLTASNDQTAAIEIAAPVQWLERDADHRFTLHTNEELTEGVKLSLTPSVSDAGVTLHSLSIEFREVGERMPIEGVSLDIGKPFIRTTTVSADLQIPDAGYLVVPLQPLVEQSGQIFVIINATVVK